MHSFDRSDDIMFKLDQLAESNMLSHTTNFTSVVQPKLPPMLEERFSFIEEQVLVENISLNIRKYFNKYT